MICPQCSANNNPNAKFCAHCGAPMNTVDETKTAFAPGMKPQTLPPMAAGMVPPPAMPTQPAPAMNTAGTVPAPNVPAPSAIPNSPNAFAPLPNSTPLPPTSARAPQMQPTAGIPQPAVAQPTVIKVEQVSTFGASLGIGLASAIVMALLTTWISASTLLDLISSAGNASIYSYSYSSSTFYDNVHIGFMQQFMVMLITGIGGQLSAHSSVADNPITGSLVLPVSFVGIALVLGTAFGAFLLAHKRQTKFRWEGVISSLAVGVVTGIIFIIFGAACNITIASSAQVYGSISGASFRTFAMGFILASLGSAAGYFLAQKAPHSSNVFSGAWYWAHRARGWVRMIVESAAIFTFVFSIIGVIIFIIAAAQLNEATGYSVFALFPMLVPFFCVIPLVMCSFGALDVSATVNMRSVFHTTLSMFNVGQIPNISITWVLWLMFVVALICAVYIALRAGARNYYDPHYAQWNYCWQAPVAALIYWLLVPLLFAQFSIGIRDEGTSAKASLYSALWFCTVAVVWAFLIELIARLIAPSIIVSAPGMWKLFAGGTVQVDTPAAMTNSVTFNTGVNASVNTSVSSAASMPSTPSMPSAPNALGTMPSTPSTPSAPIASGTATQAMSPANKRMFIIIGSAIAAIAVLGITYSIFNNTMFSPKTVANKYVQALETGNFNQANAMINPHVESSQKALITSSVAPKPGNRISNAHVTKQTVLHDQATLSISYSLGNKDYNYDLHLIKKGNSALIFPNWQIQKPWISEVLVYGPDAVTTIQINGTKIKAPTGGNATLSLYPGIYEVTLPKSQYYTSEMLKLNTQTMPAETSTEQVEAKPTEALIKALSVSVNEHLDKCVESTERAPEGCPFGSDNSYMASKTRNYSWSIVDYPDPDNYNISLSSGSFSTYDGEVKYTYESKNYDGWEPESDTMYINNMQGTFLITDKGLESDLDDNE